MILYVGQLFSVGRLPLFDVAAFVLKGGLSFPGWFDKSKLTLHMVSSFQNVISTKSKFLIKTKKVKKYAI